jgi:hypothetical protein
MTACASIGRFGCCDRESGGRQLSDAKLSELACNDEVSGYIYATYAHSVIIHYKEDCACRAT